MIPTHDLFLSLSSWLLSFLFARYFFTWWLFRDYQINSTITQLLFSVSFMFSLNIFQLILFQITNIMTVSSRQLLWQIDLIALILLIVLILPYAIMYTACREYFYLPHRRALTIVSLILSLYLYAFWQLGSNLDHTSFKNTGKYRSISIHTFISRICLLGVVLMAILSGFGAVRCPHEYISAFRRRISDEELRYVENRLQHNVAMIFAKKKRICTEEYGEDKQLKHRSGTSKWVSKTMHFFRKGGNATYIQHLRAELEALESLHKELFLDLHDMRQMQERFRRGQSYRGRLMNVMGYALSIICVYKIVMSSFNVLFNRNRQKDPITDVIEKVLYIWPSAAVMINIRAVSEMLSLFFVGVLVFTQTRGFLMTIVKVFRTYSSTVSSNTFILWLAHLMGMYFVSSFVLMRMNLNVRHRQVMDEILGDIEFNVYYRYFDIIFIVSAVCSAFVLFLLQYTKVSRTNSESMDKMP